MVNHTTNRALTQHVSASNPQTVFRKRMNNQSEGHPRPRFAFYAEWLACTAVKVYDSPVFTRTRLSQRPYRSRS
jgi:hypothetical protein